jgi:hypothetical protein
MSKEHLIHSMDSKSGSKDKAPASMIVIMVVLALALGSATGFFASKVFAGKTTAMTASTEEGAAAGDGEKSAGIMDTKQFKDSGEGTLREGGIEGEGNFHLERPGGESQNIYLTSSAVDLSKFVGKKVKVLGKTFEGEKAGWLMDVGYIEVK